MDSLMLSKVGASTEALATFRTLIGFLFHMLCFLLNKGWAQNRVILTIGCVWFILSVIIIFRFPDTYFMGRRFFLSFPRRFCDFIF